MPGQLVIARLSTAHKYLDHCKNEHDEENPRGLHGRASDRLLLPDHHFQLEYEDVQLSFNCETQRSAESASI